MYRTVDTKFWTDPKIRRLPAMEKFLFLYCLTCPHSHVSGIFYLPLVLIQHETGLPMEDVEYGIDTLSEGYLIRFDTTNEVLWVRHMLRYQPKGEKIRQAVAAQLHNLHNCSLINEFLEEYADLAIPYRYPIDGITRARCKEQEQEQNQEQEQDQDLDPLPLPPPSGGMVGEDRMANTFNRDVQTQAKEVLSHLNKVTGRDYHKPGEIPQRLAEGSSVQDCILVIDWWRAYWSIERPNQVSLLNVTTPFNRDKFDGYRALAVQWHEGGRHPPTLSNPNGIRPKSSTADREYRTVQAGVELAQEIMNHGRDRQPPLLQSPDRSGTDV